MQQEEFDEFIRHLDDAGANLRSAWLLMDGIEGFADGGEHAFAAATAAIDAVREIEVAHRRDHPPEDDGVE